MHKSSTQERYNLTEDATGFKIMVLLAVEFFCLSLRRRKLINNILTKSVVHRFENNKTRQT